MTVETRIYSEMLYSLAGDIDSDEGCFMESAETLREAAQRLDEQTVTIRSLIKQRDELLAKRNWPVMGYGKVAIGGGLQPDGTSALLYLDMGETRPIDADTTDLFPVGSHASPEKLLACVRFKDESAIQQTIDVLTEMKAEIASVKGEPCKTCNGEGGHEVSASSTNYFWKECQDCDGGRRAGYECPVCRQSDCRGCAKGGAA